MKKKIVLLFSLLVLISCGTADKIDKSYLSALILKAENERNPKLLEKAYLKAGKDLELIKKIAVASGRIPCFSVFESIAQNYGDNREVSSVLATASMFKGFNMGKNKLFNLLFKTSFTGETAKALLNLDTPLALNVVLNRDKMSNYKYSKTIAFNLWRAKNSVKDEDLLFYYKKHPTFAVYSLYRLKKRGIAKAEDLKNGDLTAKFYGMFVVDNPEMLIEENRWQLQVGLIKAKNNLKTAKMYLNSKNPLVRRTAIEYFLKNGGSLKEIKVETLTEAEFEYAVNYIKSEKTIYSFFKKGGFFAKIAAPYLKKDKEAEVMSSQIDSMSKALFLERNYSLEKAVSFAEKMLFEKKDIYALVYLLTKINEGKIKGENIKSFVAKNQKVFYSFLEDFGFASKKLPNLPLSYYYGAIQKVSELKGFVIKTEKGEIKCRFLPDKAPLTCLNFTSLVEKKYFNGIYFHRVVPAFVAQDGDRSGTGSGGPGYSIRCEYNSVKYSEEGIVGMALAGKDTGGSQYFITHIATPHLDYNYTVFAKVVHGLNTLALIDKYTKIEEIVLYE